MNIEDRDNQVEYLRMALIIAEINVSYEVCDLIRTIQLNLNNGNISVLDCVKIRQKWKKKWKEYNEKKSKISA